MNIARKTLWRKYLTLWRFYDILLLRLAEERPEPDKLERGCIVKTLLAVVLVIAFVVVSFSGVIYAKTITVVLCDECDKQVEGAGDFYEVKHNMTCNNDPGTWQLCSTKCLAKWANKHKVTIGLTFITIDTTIDTSGDFVWDMN